jgi:hypothetical protein|nr:MAG TPA: homing endonuclease [Caudoviricetes sp.]
MNEIWKDIEGYEGLYQVSNLGRVKSFDSIDKLGRIRKGRVLKGIKDVKGYLLVNLYKNSIVYTKRLHRLVAETFIPNLENKPQVNHIDENKANNIVSNLEWMTAKENINHGTRNERMSRTQSIPIIATNIKTGESQEFYGTAECARQLALHHGNITSVLKGNRNHTDGYTFKYKGVE